MANMARWNSRLPLTPASRQLHNRFKAPGAVQARDDRGLVAGDQQQPMALPERIEQSGAAINGNVIARGNRAMGGFPESPAFETSSHMTTPAIPTRL
ncbi:hypothetical protein [Stenotrophomonas maltophilia]|uniref:hypothetical protein n=1 Tax=Stenotrophomonas maltophilia TaxID=40324 RepID=UPI0039C1171F